MVTKLLLRPAEVAEAIGIGRSKIYELLASGELPFIRIGGSVRVPLDRLREWIDRKGAEATETRPTKARIDSPSDKQSARPAGKGR